jgi:hypothetical protein
LVTGAGFEILYEEIDKATERELYDLSLLDVHPDFKEHFTEVDLSAQIYRVVARKPLR